MDVTPLIDVRDLSVGFQGRTGRMLPVLRNIDLRVHAGEAVGIVGESGSGKSTLALAMMGYLKRGLQRAGGSVAFAGEDLFALAPSALDRIRGGKLALIPQNAGQSLTPTMRIGAQLAEVLRLHGHLASGERQERAVEQLRRVRLPDPGAIARRYPHELSGGQQQRVAIAMALAGEPSALLLDEPTTGLDVTTQAHILDLLAELAAGAGTAMVYVSHDLGAIASVCSRVVVMYAGEIVLEGDATRVLVEPVHPYPRGLLASIPRLSDARLPVALDGRPPAPGAAGDGCAFADRCRIAEQCCREARPPLEQVASGERVRCYLHARSVTVPVRSAAAVRPSAVRVSQPLLQIADLAISYARPGIVEQMLGRAPSATPTVAGISLSVAQGEALALVGESGSGKSSILKAIAGLLAPAGGSIALTGVGPLPAEVEQRSADQLRRIQLVFQNPDESLNPRHTIAEILAQPLKLYFGLDGRELRERAGELLDQVRLGTHYLDRLPSQLSGGEKQRVAIARAFAAEPALVLCDEVTSALDVSVQAAVLDLLDALRRDKSTAYVLVSHDLAVVRAIADRVAVLYQGRLCEIGSTAAVYGRPVHPYTEALMAAVLEPEPGHRPALLAEDVVELSPPDKGCPFQRRCHRRAGGICDSETPPARTTGDGHVIFCHRTSDDLATLQSQAPCR